MRKLGILFAALVGLAACGKAKEGDGCTSPQCEDDKTAFYCEDGHYRAIPCPGPKGCFEQSNNQNWIVCDITGSKQGDACPAEYRLAVFCESATHALVCNGGVLVDRDCHNECVSGKAEEGGSCP